MSKIADFLRAGCEVTILFADLHAYLDNQKAPWELLKHRTEYYEAVIKEMLKSIGVSIEKLNFRRGTEYQLSREYTLDMYKLTTVTTERNAKKAGADVVKQTESPCLSGMLYPLLQALDEEYLKVDAQFGGVDQRKIFTLSEACLPQLGYAKRLHLMNPMVPGLSGAKMSSSEASSKIDLLDSPDSIKDKLKKAFCPEKVVEENGVLSFVKMVLFAVAGAGKGFTIRRDEKFGGNTEYATYEELEAAYVKGDVFPLDLKNSVAIALNELLAPIRQAFSSKEMQALVERAYPKPKAAEAKGPKVDPNQPNDIAKLDIKVGKVIKCENHPQADKLYVSSVDIGEAEPRQVVSGLRNFVPLEQMQGRLVAVLCNLKPSSLVGVKSFAMLLAASSADHTTVELLDIPAGAVVGERITFEGFPTDKSVPELARASEKALKIVTPLLHTDGEGVAMYEQVPFMTSAGEVKVKSLKNAPIA
jgi:tyrosyl-tRNA synthetase